MPNLRFIYLLALASSVVATHYSNANVRKQKAPIPSRLSQLTKKSKSRHDRVVPQRQLAVEKAKHRLSEVTASLENETITKTQKSLADNALNQRKLKTRIDAASTLKLNSFREIQNGKQVLKSLSALKDFLIIKPLTKRQQNLLEQSKRLSEQIQDLNTPLEQALAAEHLAKIALEKPPTFEMNARLAKLNQHLVKESRIPRDQLALHRSASKAWQVKGFVTSKPNEVSQDAYAANPLQGRFAIADGVSDSHAPEFFSQALTRGWTESPFWQENKDEVDSGAFYKWMDSAGEQWQDLAPAKPPKKSSSRRKSIPNGSSTFVGVDVIAKQGKHFIRTTLVGDSALFVVRGGNTIFKSHDLNAVKTSATSAIIAGRDFEHDLEIYDPIEVQNGDKVYMVTDAVAKWVLEELQNGAPPFQQLDNIQNISQWRKWVEGSRLTKELDVDDSTLLAFTIPNDPGALE